ncbi:RusA family crossover junction endodeoxyribonuclease [Latilactobacillus curvatus]|nr:RusA family crossover junction endodeoxyribonuclease [Latilactobacillus curvatus]WCZ54890.1 putative holliday junction resolvase [Latilactobacillus phage TMW 1.706 P2]MCT3530885.1 RusA family crossover junction endodeoxyribonuclease [Latilactobacillus curvatus]MDG2988656.1 RusA family crossover junction endodeoxyribonuclease [Latilactobacillus curvatus]QAS49291.1 RusA family crossover junction endodeoxyribonuclease [Latilactobacillus curvatus JCM 1096 = DSM 20019]GED82774.1 endonuclease [La
MKLVIMGEPVAAGRPRFSSRGGFAKAYDPKKSRDYKKMIKKQAMQQLPSDYEPFACPIEVDIKVYRSIQKSVSKKEYARRFSNEVRPTVKPDADNYIKIILDGLNGLVWLDDNQITDVAAHKYYSDKPRVEVEVNGS